MKKPSDKIKAKIIAIGEHDTFFYRKEEMVGQIGTMHKDDPIKPHIKTSIKDHSYLKGWSYGSITIPDGYRYFYQVKVKVLTNNLLQKENQS